MHRLHSTSRFFFSSPPTHTPTLPHTHSHHHQPPHSLTHTNTITNLKVVFLQLVSPCLVECPLSLQPLFLLSLQPIQNTSYMITWCMVDIHRLKVIDFHPGIKHDWNASVLTTEPQLPDKNHLPVPPNYCTSGTPTALGKPPMSCVVMYMYIGTHIVPL